MLSKLIISSILSLFILLSAANAAPALNRDQIEQKIQQNVPQEIIDQVEGQIFQVAYTVMDRALLKSDQLISQIQKSLEQVPEQGYEQGAYDLFNSILKDLDSFVAEEQEALHKSTTANELRLIKDDIIDETKGVFEQIQNYLIANADQIAFKAEKAIDAIEKQCGADVTKIQSQLTDLRTKIDEAKLSMKNKDVSQEDLQKALQSYDPSEINQSIQDLSTELNNLVSQCQQ